MRLAPRDEHVVQGAVLGLSRSSVSAAELMGPEVDRVVWVRLSTTGEESHSFGGWGLWRLEVGGCTVPDASGEVAP